MGREEFYKYWLARGEGYVDSDDERSAEVEQLCAGVEKFVRSVYASLWCVAVREILKPADGPRTCRRNRSGECDLPAFRVEPSCLSAPIQSPRGCRLPKRTAPPISLPPKREWIPLAT